MTRLAWLSFALLFAACPRRFEDPNLRDISPADVIHYFGEQSEHRMVRLLLAANILATVEAPSLAREPDPKLIARCGFALTGEMLGLVTLERTRDARCTVKVTLQAHDNPRSSFGLEDVDCSLRDVAVEEQGDYSSGFEEYWFFESRTGPSHLFAHLSPIGTDAPKEQWRTCAALRVLATRAAKQGVVPFMIP